MASMMARVCLRLMRLPSAVRAAAPAGVDQPDAGVVLLHLRGEQLGVLARMPDEERAAEARRERGLRFRHAHLGAGDLGRVAADEVIHRVRRRQRTDRRQHAKRVAGEEDDVGRMAGHAGDLGVADELNGIGAARVLRDAGVGEVHGAVVLEHDVFQHRAEAQGLEDVRLVLRREVDGLGVAAAFDVEDAVVAPAMLVVADEVALRVGGERRLAGAAQAEQQRRAAGLLVRRRRAVHRQDAALRREVVGDGEHALLHLAGVLGAEDDQFAVFEAEVDARLGAHAGGEAVGGECARRCRW